MKKYKIHILILLLLFITLNTSAANSLEDLIKNSPGQADYPEAAGIILRNETEADFTQLPYRVKVNKVIKVFNSRGIEKYEKMNIRFNSKNENIKIIEAKTIKPDGTEVKVKENAINVITPSEDSQSNIYSNAKIKVLNIPALEDNAVIYVSYIREIKESVIEGEFSTFKHFQFREPSRNIKFSVTFPNRKRLYYDSINFDLKPDITETDKTISYTWQKDKMKQIEFEPRQPQLDTMVAQVGVSSLGSWKPFYKWYNSLLKNQYQTDTAISNKVKELTTGKKTEKEKIQAIYNYVATNIMYNDLELGISGYKPHTAAEIYKDKYGDCKDKTILLITMLKEIGVKGEPVLININTNPSLAIVSEKNFNHMITYLPDKNLYLDATSSNSMYGELPYYAQGKKVIHPNSAKITTTPILPAESNTEHIKQNVLISKDGNAIIDFNWTSKGYSDLSNKALFKQFSPEQRKLILNQVFKKSQGLSNPEIISCKLQGIEGLEHYFTCDVKVKSDSYGNKTENQIAFSPVLIEVNLNALTSLKKRKTPLYLKAKISAERHYKIKIPVEYSVEYLPEDISINNDIGQFNLNYEVDQNTITVSFGYQFNKISYTPEDYQELIEFTNKITTSLREKILIK